MAREILWTELEMCGTAELQQTRESICTLIRYHGLPLNFLKKSDYERVLIEAASHTQMIKSYSMQMLEILVRADVKGRIADDTPEQLETLEMFATEICDLGISDEEYKFTSDVTKHAYLNGKNVPRDYELYDNTWKKVIIVCGLPGTGKDTWIRNNYPNLPMISLDDIRKELKILPTDKKGQGKVANVALDRAKEYLRKKQAFVWNSTNVTKEMRQKCLSLFEEYGAYTHIVYLETKLSAEFQRNRNRQEFVPEAVIYKLLKKTELPSVKEAHRVEWVIV